MSYKNYLLFRKLILFTLLVGVCAGLLLHNVLPAILAIGLGVAALTAVRASTSAVVFDERNEKISDRASRGAFALSAVIFALNSLAFLVFNQGNLPFPDAIGTLFGYVAILMLTLYLLLYWIYSRGMGGADEK